MRRWSSWVDPAEGVVGYGSGKAKEVPQAIRKGIEAAKKNLLRVNLTQDGRYRTRYSAIMARAR